MGTDSTIEVSKNRRGKAGGAPNGNSNPLKHGLSTLKAATTKLGSRAIDGRSSLSYQLKKWRRELVNDLGGDDNISTQQSALIDLAVKSKLLIDTVDAWLLAQPSFVNKRKKALLPVVLQRQQRRWLCALPFTAGP